MHEEALAGAEAAAGDDVAPHREQRFAKAGGGDHVHAGGDGQGELTLLDFAMRYHDRYAQEGGVWKFADRQLEVVWVERRTAAPFSAAMMGRELRGF